MVLQGPLTGRPFKNAVKYDNSVFNKTSFAISTFVDRQLFVKTLVSMRKLARRLDETHGSESVSKHRFVVIIYICKEPMNIFTHTNAYTFNEDDDNSNSDDDKHQQQQ